MKSYIYVLLLVVLVSGFTCITFKDRLHAAGCDIYVDSVFGNDANNGTTLNTPLQHLSVIPALSSGTTLCLKRGSVFKESLIVGIQNVSSRIDNVTVRDYGPSHLPVPMIDGSEVIPASAWTEVGGSFPNLYQATVEGPTATTTPYGTLPTQTSYFVNMFECKTNLCTPTGLGGNDNFLAYQTTQSGANSNAGSFYIPGQTSTVGPSTTNPLTIYIRTTDGSNPATNGYIYSYTKRQKGLTLFGMNAIINNIATKKVSGNNGSFEIAGDGTSATFNNVEADQGGKHNMYCGGGCTVNNSKFVDEYYPSSGNMFVAFDQNGSGLPITLNNNTFYNGVLAAGNSVTAIYAHVGAGTIFPNLFINGGLIQGIGGAGFGGMSGGQFSAITVNGMTCKDVSKCIFTSGTTTISNVHDYSLLAGKGGLVSSAGGNFAINVNSSLECGTLGASHGPIEVGSGVNLSIASSTLYMKGSGNVGILPGTSTVSLMNTIIDSDQSFNAWMTLTNSTSSYTGNFNSFVLPNVGKGTINSTLYTSLANWKAATLQDVNSTTTGSGVSACTLNAFSISGPTSGNANSPSTNFTVTPNRAFTGTVTFNLLGTGAEGLSPVTLTFTNSAASQTFTITPTVAGSITLDPLVNGSISVPTFLPPAVAAYTSVDVTEPIVFGVTSSGQTTSATIIWITNEAASSTVQYGLSTSYGSQATSSGTVSHSVMISNLVPGTAYNFKITAIDAATNMTTSSNYTFTTGSVSIPLGPRVTYGGGGEYSTSFTVPVAAANTVVSVSVPVQNPLVSIVFKKDLKLGLIAADVKLLQQYLNAHGFLVSTAGAGSKGKETTLFGPATQKALIKFQKANNITPASGYFGSITKAFIKTSSK